MSHPAENEAGISRRQVLIGGAGLATIANTAAAAWGEA
jgi:hypothetical protein